MNFHAFIEDLGRRLADLSPRFAELALAFPRWFTWAASIFFRRLFRGMSAVALVFFGFLVLPWGALIANEQVIRASIPDNRTVIDFVAAQWAMAQEVAARLESDDHIPYLFLAGIILVIAILILPTVFRIVSKIIWTIIKLYFFFIPGFIVTWMFYIISGRYVGIFKSFCEEFGEENFDRNGLPKAQQRSVGGSATASVPNSEAISIEAGALTKGVIEPSKHDAGVDQKEANRSPQLTEPSVSNVGHPDPVLFRQQEIDLVQIEMKSRFTELLREIQRRGETNLGIGMLFSIIGVVILFTLVLFGEARSDFVSWFIPRLSVAFFIQIFAYFFLRLYKDNLADIKYFNNEISNLEYKKIASRIALSPRNGRTMWKGQSELLSSVCLELLRTERNFILKKGENAAYPPDWDEKPASVADLTIPALKTAKDLLEIMKSKSG